MNEIYINKFDLPRWLREKWYFCEKDMFSIEELIEIIEDLDDELENVKEKFADYKEYVKSNYKELSQAEQVE